MNDELVTAVRSNRQADHTGRPDDEERIMCQHWPPCPAADRPDHAAARTVAFHPEQGWSLLCNGVVVFDDAGELLPDGRAVAPAPRSAAPVGRLALAA
jgi:hypothetical protein